MYSYRFDHHSNALDIRWERIFTPQEVALYAADLQAAFLRERFRPGYRLLIDMSACVAQPRDTLAAFERAMGNFPKASRIAIVAVNAVMQAQVRRVMTQPYLQVFTDPAPARDWLVA
ncbi:STAS/SEC14 domain-containing protein [Sphingomonas adhaesiva]|uniref:STAS/SEC14 domain-containing protein n=1 Tax=Sphingomonas adhaesiva TaxID=28212 RepID=UPI002FF5364D